MCSLVHSQKGFTLFESILYIGLVGMVFSVMSFFVMNVYQARAKTRAIAVVAHNARVVQEKMHYAIRHATGVNTGASIFGADPGTLSLQMQTPSENPTLFSLTVNDGQVQMKSGSSVYIPITTQDVSVTNFVFTNLTTSADIGIIRAQFTIQAVNQTGKPYDAYTKTFQTTLRIPLGG